MLVPANATLLAPPEAAPGHAAAWVDDAWELLVDLRGTVVWLADGSSCIIDQLGPLPAGASTEPPTSSPPEQRRAQRDDLLAQSDWTQLCDTLLDQPELKASWAEYRTALRRLDLEGDEWPEAPLIESAAS
jgi:hypothetical protein